MFLFYSPIASEIFHFKRIFRYCSLDSRKNLSLISSHYISICHISYQIIRDIICDNMKYLRDKSVILQCYNNAKCLLA